MSKRFVTMLAGVMALAMLVAGCGDSDAESAALTKAQFVKQGDARCLKIEKKVRAEYNADARKYFAERKPPSLARGEELAEKYLLPGREAQYAVLEDLSPPSDDEDQVEAITAAAEAGTAKAEENPASIYDPKTSPYLEADKLAREYGFKVCGGA